MTYLTFRLLAELIHSGAKPALWHQTGPEIQARLKRIESKHCLNIVADATDCKLQG